MSRLADPYMEGYCAASAADGPRPANPYPEGSDAAIAWDLGFEAAEQEDSDAP
jgi:hypothetical protein